MNQMFKFQPTAGGGSGGSGATSHSSGGLYAGIRDDEPEAKDVVEQKVKAESTPDKANKEPAPNWSASLGFQPVVRKKPARPAKPNAMHATPAIYSSAPVASISAPPVVYSAEPQLNTEPAPSFSKSATTLTTEDDDVNGFKSTESGRKANKKRKRKGQFVDPSRDFTADYDPSKPNDYAQWKAYRRTLKTEKKAQERALQRKQEVEAAAALAGEVAQAVDEGDGESDQSEEEAPRPAPRGRFFAPPASYNEPSAEMANPPILSESGEDAYQRRLAMSASSENPVPPLSHNISLAESGEEAYQRRLAMSRPVEQVTSETAPSAGSAHSQPSPSFVPAAMPPIIEANSSSASIPPQQGTISEAQAKARAIAERLGKLGGGANTNPNPAFSNVTAQPEASTSKPVKKPQVVSDDESERPTTRNPQAFAARLMAKYGWKKGQGLGASEDGMTSALHVKSSTPVSGKGAGQSSGPVGMNSGTRGTIISESREAREVAEKARFGEPSKFVCLTNMVSPHEVDNELADEIAEEAGKHGIVARCFTHTMPFNTPDHEAVRIFIEFSGVVGAWQAVKAFDGRFFGGRAVRARFYDPVWIDRKILGMPFQVE